MRFADFDHRRIDAVLPPIPGPAPQVHIWTERQWRDTWTREKNLGALSCVGLYRYAPEPVIYVRGGRYACELDLTYAHEQAHHRWRFGMSRRQRAWWTRWVAANPDLLPELKCTSPDAEEWFAETFGRYFTGRAVHPATARRLREVCGLPPGEERMRRIFVTPRRRIIRAQLSFDL